MNPRFFAVIVVGLVTSAAAEDSPSWQKTLTKMFDEESTAFERAKPANRSNLFACNFYVERALKVVFGDKATIPAGQASEKAKKLANSEGGWELIGDATSVEAIVGARDSANAGTPVVAVGNDHIALLVPYAGPPLDSGKWKMGHLPCVTNWHKGQKEASFIVGKISRGWGSPKGVKFYKLPSAAVQGVPPTKECLGREDGRGPAAGQPDWPVEFEP